MRAVGIGGPLILLLALLFSVRSVDPGNALSACGLVRWNEPVQLSSEEVVARSPSLSVSANRQVVTASDFQFPPRRLAPGLDAPLTAAALFLAIHPDRPSFRNPPSGDFQFLNPRVLLDGDERIHVVWAESAVPITTRRDTFAPRLSDLWYSVLNVASGDWSEPTHLIRARDVEWAPSRSSMTLDRDRRSLHLFFGATLQQEVGVRSRTLRLTIGRGGDVAIDTVLWSKTSYLAVSLDDDEGTIAYVDSHPEFGPNRLHVAKSDDAGASWGTPVVLDPFEPGRVVQVWLFRGSSGDVHLLSLHVQGNDVLSGERIARFRTLSPTLAEPGSVASLTLPPGFNRATAEMDACGELHLVSEVTDASVLPRLVHHRLANGRWTRDSGPEDGLWAMHPVLAADRSRQNLFLAWTGARAEEARGEAPSSVYLTRSLRASSGGGP